MQKTVVLTENNIKHILTKLKKFFFNPKYGYIAYHNFDCGYKNIKPYYKKEKDVNVDVLEIDYDYKKEPFIRISFQEGVSGTVLHLGTRFLFKGGNEIIVQEPWIYGSYNYVYTVYRLCKLDEKDKEQIYYHRECDRIIAEDYWDDYREDCCMNY